jgi:ABC-2 type transport system ATP-binding protein
MPFAAVNLPSGATALALLPLIVLMLALVAYSLVRLLRAEQVAYLPKWAWALIVVLVIPWGAIVYLLLARSDGPTRTVPAPPAAAPLVPAPPAPVAAVGPPVVTTSGLTRDYGGGAGLFDVDLRVPRGAVYGLVGPNGAGKSTLLSILTGVRRADRGAVDIAVPRSRIAVCPDVPEFEAWLTAFEVVDLARFYVAPDRGPDAVWSALRAAGLAEDAGRRTGGFSRGMTQRLGLAAALVGDPDLLVLDEPTSALDPAGRAEILDLVSAMRGRRTVIFSSHILADVQRVADHVGVLRRGRLLYQGETRTLIDEHLTPSWVLRLGSASADVVAKLRGEAWVRRVEEMDEERIRVDADSIEHGERGIPEILASCRARLVACEPLAADLEAAFLALTGREDRS